MPTKGRNSRSRSEVTTNLEIFALAAVGAGLDTAYDLHTRADLSVGTVLPLLARLQEGGLVRSESAARRSRRYTLTAAGKATLRSQWPKVLETVPAEFEAILRLVYLAAILESDLKRTKTFLKSAAAERERLALAREQRAQAIAAAPTAPEFGRGHRWLRAHTDAARLRAESRVLLELAGRRDLSAVLGVRL
jgi:DNA-binding PadR family transcriptional regulator